MRRKLAVLLSLAVTCRAQQINPNQIQPATTNGYVLTTVTAGSPPSWQPSTGGGGTGTINPAGQYEIPLYVSPGTTNEIGDAGRLAQIPATLTPAQKSAFINAFSYYSGNLLVGDTGPSTPANPYSHAPFTNTLGVPFLGDKFDVPKFPSNVKDYGAQCDAGAQLISTVAGSNHVTLSSPNGTSIANAVVAGMSIGVVGTVSGVPTAWEPIIVSVSGSTATTFDNAPFTVTNAPSVYGHDDTVYIQSVLNGSVGLPAGIQGKPTLPAGTCLVHTLVMSNGPSLQGQGVASDLEGFPGEDVIALSDPNNPPAGVGYFGQSQPVQDNDFHLSVNSYIDATQAWKQVVTLPSVPTGACIEGNFTGCSTTTNNFAADALNRHWGRRSPWSNNPIGPGWCTGDDQADGNLCVATVASVTNGNTSICIPTAAPQPTSGDTVVFPYLTPAFKTTIGSQTTCTGGTQFTLGAVYPGTTSTQQEFMAGTAFQSLNAGINSTAVQFVGNLAVHPQWFADDNVGSHGLVKIDSEQISYTVVKNENNTFLNLVRGVNGTTAASHSTNALIVPLNPVIPTRPWPVTPSLTVGTATTPVGAEFYPAGAVGNAAYAMPLLSGSNVAYVGLGDGSYLRNITMDTVGGVGDTTNNSAGLWISQLPYSALFERLFITGVDFGSAMSPPTNNYTFMTEQSSCNSTVWNKVTIRSNHGWYNLCGGQATFSNMDVYNTLGVVGWVQWAEPNDQGSGQSLFGGGDLVQNVYNEDNGGGGEGISEPEDAFFASNDTINNAQWVSSNIFPFIGNGNTGSDVNFPNGSTLAPLIMYGSGNKLTSTGALGPNVQNSNVWGTGTVLNYGNLGGNNVEGTPAGGVYQNLSFIGTGSRAVAGFQTGESALLGNVTPTNQISDLNSGLIYPGEINVKSSGRPTGMDGLITDFNAPFNAAVYCKGSSTTCVPQNWIQCDQICSLVIAAGSRIVPTTYTVYIPYRASAGTPTETILLQVWTGVTATTVGTANVTNSTSWQVAEIDNVNLGAYSGYTLGISTGSFSSSTANYYIGGVEFAPIAQKLIVQNATCLGTCTGFGGSGGAVTSVIPGTNVTCSPLVSGNCVGNVTINSTAAGITGLTVGTTMVSGGTSNNVLTEVSGVLQSLSPTIMINSTPCTLGSTCTISGGGSGTITGVTAGTNLSGGGTSGTVTLNVIASPSFTTVQHTGNVTAATSGAWQMWNVASGAETDFVNNPGSGSGGFNFYNTTSGGTLGTAILTIDGGGNENVLGTGTFLGSGSPGVTLSPTGTAISGTNFGSVPLTLQSSHFNSIAILDSWKVTANIGTGSTPSPALVFSGPSSLPTNDDVVYELDPSIAATSGQNYSSPSVLLKGLYWNGSASAVDTWFMLGSLGTGANPFSVLTFTHSGTTGNATVALPGLQIADPVSAYPIAENVTPAATSTNNNNAPGQTWNGTYWTGSASATDSWFMTPVLGSGANPFSILTYTHSGTTGTAALQVPNLKVASVTVAGCATFASNGDISSSGVGCNAASTQTGYTVGSGRSIGTVYQNTGSTTRIINVTLTGTSGFINAYTNPTSFTLPGGNTLASWNSGGSGGTLTFWVLPGSYYGLYTTGTISANQWWELQL